MSTIIRKIFTEGREILVVLFSLPKTIIFNLKYFLSGKLFICQFFYIGIPDSEEMEK